MGYALFAQQKVSLTGRVNSISLQQTQRSNEQNTLATQQLSLQQELSNMQASQSQELTQFYEILSHVVTGSEDSGGKIQEKGTLDQDYIDSFGAKYEDSNKEEHLNRNLDDYSPEARAYIETAMGIAENPVEISRENINADIKKKQSEFDAELADINNEIYQVSVKENVIEMEVKRLDTALTSAQKELEGVEEAEGDAIDKATPKFQGMG